MEYSKVLNQIVLNAVNQIALIPDSEMSEKPVSTKWSKKEILGHLVDSAYNNHKRFVLSENQDRFIFEGYDQDSWVKNNDYQNRDLQEILDLWKALNVHMSFLIRGISQAQLHQTFTLHNFHQICMKTLNEGEESSMSYLIWDYIFHIEHHLNQIIPNYKRMNSETNL